MNYHEFLKDSRLKFPKDSHALFSASNYHWINYPIEKMMEKVSEEDAKKMGSDLHSLACQLITMKVKLPDVEQTLNMYVNDCILYGMYPEKQLWFSEEFHGTADAMTVDENTILKVSDLKTGKIKASMNQLKVYVALFCLECRCSPSDFSEIQMRIYQNNSVNFQIAEADDILPIMDKMMTIDRLIRKMKDGGYYANGNGLFDSLRSGLR